MSARASFRSWFALAAAALPGCAVVAGAGVGYVVYEEVLDNDVHVAQVQDDVDKVWASTRETLSYLVDPKTEVKIQAFPRRAEAKIDGADVTVEVEAHDLDRTLIRVDAKKYLTHDGGTAGEVMREILDRLH